MRFLTIPYKFAKVASYKGLLLIYLLMLLIVYNAKWPTSKNEDQKSSHVCDSNTAGINGIFHQRLNGSFYLNSILTYSKLKLKSPMITIDEFRRSESVKTGNTLIDDFHCITPVRAGDRGTGVVLVDEEKITANNLLDFYRVNVIVSDLIPLNRIVPDSRPALCKDMSYTIDGLPDVSVIVPFHNEWPSLLLRTVYSLINMTPRRLLKEIILIDDCSTELNYNELLRNYIDAYFPKGLVRLHRLPERIGLIKARMIGWNLSTAEVIVIFDSHMEVNHNWLPPLVSQIKNDRKSVAMATLDYIRRTDFAYEFYKNQEIRYGFSWSLEFFETYWRRDQQGFRQHHVNKPGPVTVGTAFAVERKFFGEIGAYDNGLDIWGGENLELSWRVWLCGGSMIHVPCSRVGHLARPQPYKFPGGRANVVMNNYKRIVDTWFGENKKFVYSSYLGMDKLLSGDLSSRMTLKSKLQCRPFSWYIENIWPELNVFDVNSTHWGVLSNQKFKKCIDTGGYLFNVPADMLTLKHCQPNVNTQVFSLSKSGMLKSALQCIIVLRQQVLLGSCFDDWTSQIWLYDSVSSLLLHRKTQMCLQAWGIKLNMTPCSPDDISLKWTFISIAF